MHDAASLHPALVEARDRIQSLLSRAEDALAMGEPEVVSQMGPQLIRTLKAVVQVAPQHWPSEAMRRKELSSMSARIGALQLALARAQAALARERGLLMPGVASEPTYGPDGRVGLNPSASEAVA